jgi:23S rRNA pseudouridine2605 synthase
MSKKYPSSPPRPKNEADDQGSDSPINPEALVRLQKVLASAGHGSRRACEELITTGRVDIDGKTVTQLGTKVDPSSQIIRVDGEALAKPKLRYFLVNKPLGVLSTNSDPAGRARVVDLVRSDARLFTVGRLDKSSEGLIIVTNDGELANLLSHPRYGVEKTYLALVAGEPDKKVFDQLQNGVHLAEGWAHAKTVRIKARQQHSTLLEIVLDEGRNREVRRLLARVGHKVLRLQRIAQGSLRLGSLAPGEYRPLTLEEVEQLKEGARESINKPKPKRPRKTKENTLKFEEPADDLEPSLYDSSAQSTSYEADDDDISSGAEVDQFFKSAGSVISDDEGDDEAPAKPAKKARRVVKASTSLKPIIDLRVKKPKAEKPAELNVVMPSDDDDDLDDGEEDFIAGFPGTGSGEEAAAEGDEGEAEPKPRRKMMPGFAKKKEALGKKFDRKNAKARAERGGDDRPRRSYGDGERKPRFGDRAGGGYQGKRPYGGGAGRGESRGYGARGGDARGGESRGGFRGKPSGDRPYKPRFNKEGGEASGEGGGERRSFGGRSGTRTPGGGGYQGKRPYGGDREGGAPRGRRPDGGGFRGKASGGRPFKPRFNEGGEGGGDAPQGERKRFAAFNKAKRFGTRSGEGTGGARGGKPGFGARPGGKPRLNKERTGDGGKTFGRSKFGGKEGGPRKSTGYAGTRRGSGRGFIPKTEGGPSKGGPKKGGPRGKGKRD